MAGKWMASALILRQASVDDAPAIASLYAHYVRESVATFELDAPDASAMAGRIAGTLDAELPWIVARIDGALAGYAYAGRFHPRAAYRFTVEPTVYCAVDVLGRGVGSRLYAALMTILGELRYREAIALVTLPNPASEALHRRLSFSPCGRYQRAGFKDGQWLDVGLFQRSFRGDQALDSPPPEPRPLAMSPSWRALA